MPWLPPKRKRPKAEHRQQRVFPTHRAFVRRHQCCIKGCQGQPIEFALAAEFARKTPDRALRESLKLVNAEEIANA